MTSRFETGLYHGEWGKTWPCRTSTEACSSETDAKVSIVVTLVLIVTALFDLRVSAGIATVYLVFYGVYRLRRERREKERSGST